MLCSQEQELDISPLVGPLVCGSRMTVGVVEKIAVAMDFGIVPFLCRGRDGPPLVSCSWSGYSGKELAVVKEMHRASFSILCRGCDGSFHASSNLRALTIACRCCSGRL